MKEIRGAIKVNAMIIVRWKMVIGGDEGEVVYRFLVPVVNVLLSGSAHERARSVSRRHRNSMHLSRYRRQWNPDSTRDGNIRTSAARGGDTGAMLG